MGEPNIKCARCHGTLANHVPDQSMLVHEGRDCILTADDVREQVYAWADYALGNPDRARDRNYAQRIDCRGTNPKDQSA